MKRKLSGLLLVFVVALAGCGGAVEAPAGPSTIRGQIFQIALPRIVVDVDSEGNPSVLGVSPVVLSALGVNVAGFKLPQETVAMASDAGIQHVNLTSVGDRLLIFVDSKPLPHIGWSVESMERALNLAEAFDVQNAQTLKSVLPLITRLGLDIVLRFPRAAGVPEIPFIDPNVAKTATTVVSSDPVSAIVKFEVSFNVEGHPGVMGLSAADLQALGLSLGQISPALITKLQDSNLQHLELRTQPNSLYVYANGEALPNLIWDGETLGNLMDVYRKVGKDTPLLPLIENVLPFMDQADIGILLHFPVATGESPIPAQMH